MAEWSVQNYHFHSTLKVLELGLYDMIVDMDWLQAFSPMKIHWEQKWLLIPYGSTQIVLQGILPDCAACFVIQLHHIASEAPTSAESAPLPELQVLLDKFAHLFAEPTELPPHRPCDHSIPLIPGTQPMSV